MSVNGLSFVYCAKRCYSMRENETEREREAGKNTRLNNGLSLNKMLCTAYKSAIFN